MSQDPYKYFRIEAHEILEQMGKGVLELEKDSAAPDLVARLLRLAHTLKGAARVVKQREIADFAHAIEDTLTPFREGGIMVPRDQVDTLLSTLDSISAQTSALSPPKDVAPTAAPHSSPEDALKVLRADADEMDSLLDGVVEVSVRLASLRHNVSCLEPARRLTELLDAQLGSRSIRHEPGSASAKARSIATELRETVEIVERSLISGVEQIDRELRQVRESAERLRLLPARLMFNALERSARDAAQHLGKRVTFVATGGDVGLDAHLLGVVQKALVQTVRNAVAHGIEQESERRLAGKDPTGLVSIEVRLRGNRVAFSCRDDGQGVDVERVRQAAVDRGLISPDTKDGGVEAALGFLFAGGVTTSPTVTEVSGRGIGLDVVQDSARELGGHVSVQTKAGEGTTVEIIVPVSLSSLGALVVEASDRTAAIPLESIKQTLRVLPSDQSHSPEGTSILFEGEVVPFVLLGHLLGVSSSTTLHHRAWSAILIQDGSNVVAVGVDSIIRTENVVLRALPDLTPASAIVAGASLDAEGNPQLVLDSSALVSLAIGSSPVSAEALPSRSPILVIDDSLTTRMLEQSILESAGYEVELATSAEEGLEKANKGRYSLFLVDVEMPGMNGFAFIERTRADPVLRDVPAILVTSRDLPEDRKRGEAVGASDYIVKSEFDQTKLLNRIRTLVEAT